MPLDPGQVAPWLAAQALRLAYAGSGRAFRAALAAPEAAQAEALRGTLAWASGTAFGQAHGFARLAAIPEAKALWAAYRQSVPLVAHEVLAPWLDRMWEGEANVLVPGQPLVWEATSGSTQGRKLLPITSRYRQQLQRGTGPWLGGLYGGPHGLAGGRGYWSISPAARQREVSPMGIPVGLEDDTAYFSTAERAVVQRLVLAPSGLARVEDMAAHRFASLVHLLAEGDGLRLVSVWHPSFFTLLLDAALEEAEALAEALASGKLHHPNLSQAQAAQLSQGLRPQKARAQAFLAQAQQARREGRGLQAREAFPGLRLLSAWADGPAAPGAAALLARSPGVAFQAKGLLATEGIVSLPWGQGPGCVAAVRSHALELLPEGGAEPLGLHEAPLGLKATLALTTGGGLYRRRLDDLVEVVGHEGATPRLRFQGKADLVSDLVGEKLAAPFVEQALAQALHNLGWPAERFVLLAPEAGPPAHYQLLVAAPLPPTSPADAWAQWGEAHAEALQALALAVAAELDANPHHAYARRLGQLGPLQARVVAPDAEARRLAWLGAQGAILGGVKPSRLAKDQGWGARLGAQV